MNSVAETAGETRTRKNKRPEETTHIGGRQCLQDTTVRHQLDVGRTLGVPFILYISSLWLNDSAMLILFRFLSLTFSASSSSSQLLAVIVVVGKTFNLPFPFH